MRTPILLAGLLVLASTPIAMAEPPRGIDIHFVDTEGGAATLIVTPAGESVLIDCGNPGKRDAERIHKATEKAGLKQIDHLIITHWHGDHYGGIDRLATLIPIKAFYDHGIPDSLSEDKKGFATLIQPYKDFSKGKQKTLRPGDEIALRQVDGKPALKLFCLCGDGKVIADKPDAPMNPIAKDHKAKPADPSDNARSLGFLLSYGDFRFLDLGDLTWNIEYNLVHPSDKIGLVDVYQVTHHGLDISNNPVLINTVKPRVAICNNGARKGAAAFVIATLRRVEGIEAIYQLHKNLTVGEAENTDAAFIANKEAECKGEGISLSVAADGKTYAVTVGSGGKAKEYKVRGVR
jgi:competence protein ComEC